MAMTFDGNKRQFINCGPINIPQNTTNSLTVCSFFRLTKKEECTIISKARGKSQNDIFWRLHVDDDKLQFMLRTEKSSTEKAENDEEVKRDVLYWGAGVYTGSELLTYLTRVDDIKLYVKSDADTSGPVKFDANRETWIGGNPINSKNSPWYGDLFDIRVYTRVLSEEEALTIVSTMGKDGIVDGLHFYWPLNEETEGTIAVEGSSRVYNHTEQQADGEPKKDPKWSSAEPYNVREYL